MLYGYVITVPGLGPIRIKTMIKTHTFKLGRYYITLSGGILGMCDTPDRTHNSWRDMKKEMIILEGVSLQSLDVAVHEAMHAEDIPEKYVHGGSPDRIAKFLWRLGWRKQNHKTGRIKNGRA